MENDSSESWDSASIDELRLTMAQDKIRASSKQSRLKILHQFLLVIECLRKERRYVLVNGFSDHEKFERIYQNNYESDNVNTVGMFCGLFPSIKSLKCCFTPPFDSNISLFVNLNMNNVPCRIYFTLGKEIESFLEYSLGNTIVEHKSVADGLCFSVDFNGYISDQTVNFSKRHSHHHFYARVINIFAQEMQALKDRSGESNSSCSKVSRGCSSAFSTLDDQRLRSIPQSVSKVKIHPIYMLEECCRVNEVIYPKRPIFGYVKGKPVFSKNNVVKLRTENGWYQQGMALKDNGGNGIKPYRIYKDRKLYAEFQTEPINIRSITGPVMDAFHPNFTPKDCVYVDYDPQIALSLGLDFAECVVGFRGKERIKRGFFVEKKYCFVVNYFVKEKEYYEKIAEEVKEIEKVVKEWKRFIKKIKRIAEIRKRVGLM